MAILFWKYSLSCLVQRLISKQKLYIYYICKRISYIQIFCCQKYQKKILVHLYQDTGNETRIDIETDNLIGNVTQASYNIINDSLMLLCIQISEGTLNIALIFIQDVIIHQPDVHENLGDDTHEIVESKVDIVVFHDFSRIEHKPLEFIHDHG